MAKDSIIIGFDIGSTAIRAVVAVFSASSSRAQIIGLGEAPSGGIRKGTIIDIEETIKSIRLAKDQAERASSVKIESAYISVGGGLISSRVSKGVVAVSRADGEISEHDVTRVIQAASAISLPQNREIIHVIPRWFSVDAESGIFDPIGMQGIRLEIDALLVDANTQLLRNIEKCMTEVGVEINGVVLDTLAASRSTLVKRQKDIGVVLLDIGGAKTGLMVFEDGNIVHTSMLPVGSTHITNDIAIGLKMGVDVAERIKREYGSSLPHEIGKKDMVEFAKVARDEVGVFSRREVAEIIEARVRELLGLANKELKAIHHEALLPGGVVMVGGGAKIPGIVDVAKEELKIPAQIGFPVETDGVVEAIDDPSYACGIGLVLWGRDLEERKKMGSISFFSPRKTGANTASRLKRFFKAFVP
ncbi:MAG: cell division protein FtsA [bacterium]|nr:cell division protein FtsA [bacterium]